MVSVRYIVDDVQDAEPATGGELIVDEVQAPALVGKRQHRSRRPRAYGARAPTARLLPRRRRTVRPSSR